jgi:hypothetical protein
VGNVERGFEYGYGAYFGHAAAEATVAVAAAALEAYVDREAKKAAEPPTYIRQAGPKRARTELRLVYQDRSSWRWTLLAGDVVIAQNPDRDTLLPILRREGHRRTFEALRYELGTTALAQAAEYLDRGGTVKELLSAIGHPDA